MCRDLRRAPSHSRWAPWIDDGEVGVGAIGLRRWVEERVEDGNEPFSQPKTKGPELMRRVCVSPLGVEPG